MFPIACEKININLRTFDNKDNTVNIIESRANKILFTVLEIHF